MDSTLKNYRKSMITYLNQIIFQVQGKNYLAINLVIRKKDFL